MFQPEYEAMNRSELEALQVDRLKATLARVYENVPMREIVRLHASWGTTGQVTDIFRVADSARAKRALDAIGVCVAEAADLYEVDEATA